MVQPQLNPNTYKYERLHWCGFFGTARGLGFATAKTSAAFSPHLEQRIRCARSFSVTFQPDQAWQRFWLNLAARAAVTDDAHQELAKAPRH